MKRHWIRKPDPFDLAVWGLIVSTIIAAIYYLQLVAMQQSVDISTKAMALDQRPWLSAQVPDYFPFNGPQIPVTIPLTNIGKTVATKVTGHIMATVFNKGERPVFDEYYGNTHRHTNAYAGAIYPNQKPLPVTLLVSKYSDKDGGVPIPIVPDAEFIRQINQQEKFIIVFGRIDYCDIFGVKHWVKVCNGSGNALEMEGVKDCINYNRPDNNTATDSECQ